MDVKIEFHIPVKYKTEGDIIVASCASLGVYTQGETQKEAEDNLMEAVTLFVESAYEMGTLLEILKDSGVAPIKKLKPRKATPKMLHVSIPMGSAKVCHA